MIERFLTVSLLDALADSPVVLLTGARQSGKTTLVQEIAAQRHQAQYISLDDATFLSAAMSDPAGFLSGLGGPAIIDEVQHAPKLFPAIKAMVDRNRVPGRFLLTGSANVLLLPRLSESLAGRMEILTLWPLAQAEIASGDRRYIDRLFNPDTRFEVPLSSTREDLAERIVSGGFPEPLGRTSAARRRAWFGSYLTTILQRDVRDIANIEGLTDLPRLLALLATRVSSLLNLADISRGIWL